MSQLPNAKFHLSLKDYLSWSGALYISVALILIVSFIWHTDSLFITKTALPTVVHPVGMENNKEYRQLIPYQDEALEAFQILFGTYGRSNKGELKVSLLCDGREVQSWNVDTAQLPNSLYKRFEIASPLIMNPLNSYTLVLKDSYEGTNNIAFYTTDGVNKIEYGGKALLNKSFAISYETKLYEQKMFYQKIISVFLLLSVIATSIFINPKKVKVRNYVLLLLFGIIAIRAIDYNLFQNVAKTTDIVEPQKSDRIEIIAPNTAKQYTIDLYLPFDTFKIYLEGNNKENIHIKISLKKEVIIDRDINYQDVIIDERAAKTVAIYRRAHFQPKTAIRIHQKRNFEPGQYTIEIKNKGIAPTKISILKNGGLNFGTSINTFLSGQITLFILAIIFIYFSVIFVLIVNRCKLAAEKWFLITVIPLAVIYTLLFNPLSQHDTGAHLKATYRFSNELLGFSETDESKWRKEDADFLKQFDFGIDVYPSLRSYVITAYYYKLMCDKTELVNLADPELRMKFYSVFSYLPQVLGLTLGRILNFGTIASIYLGRIIIMLSYIIIIYRDIKKIPIGKWIIATVALLPMALMMSNALSYDAMVIISSLSYITCIFRLKKEQSTFLYLETCFWVFVAGAVKGGGYILILLPLSFILFNAQKKRTTLCQILVICLVGIFSVCLFDKILPDKTGFQFGTDGNGKLTALFAIHEPLKYLDMAIGSYLLFLDKLSINIAGYWLAWGCEQTIPAAVVVLFMSVGGIQSIFENDGIELRKTDKWIFISIIAISLLAIPAMLLSATRSSSRVVGGIQGRYFLPILPIFYYVQTKFSLHTPCHKNYGQITSKCVVWMSILSCVMVYYIMTIYLTR